MAEKEKKPLRSRKSFPLDDEVKASAKKKNEKPKGCKTEG